MLAIQNFSYSISLEYSIENGLFISEDISVVNITNTSKNLNVLVMSDEYSIENGLFISEDISVVNITNTSKNLNVLVMSDEDYNLVLVNLDIEFEDKDYNFEFSSLVDDLVYYNSVEQIQKENVLEVLQEENLKVQDYLIIEIVDYKNEVNISYSVDELLGNADLRVNFSDGSFLEYDALLSGGKDGDNSIQTFLYVESQSLDKFKYNTYSNMSTDQNSLSVKFGVNLIVDNTTFIYEMTVLEDLYTNSIVTNSYLEYNVV